MTTIVDKRPEKTEHLLATNLPVSHRKDIRRELLVGEPLALDLSQKAPRKLYHVCTLDSYIAGSDTTYPVQS